MQILFWITVLSNGHNEQPFKEFMIVDCPDTITNLEEANNYLESKMKYFMDINYWDIVIDYASIEIGENLKTPEEKKIIEDEKKIKILTKKVAEQQKNIIRTLLMENGGIATQKTINFVSSIDPNYKEYNTENRDYMRSDDLYAFAGLIQPTLTKIVTSSAFERGMDYNAYKSFDKEIGISYKPNFLQIEYYSWLFYQAVNFRKNNNFPKLEIHINYLYENFLERLNNEDLGKDTKKFLKLMLRQSEGFVSLHIYYEYKLKYILLTEEDLKLN